MHVQAPQGGPRTVMAALSAAVLFVLATGNVASAAPSDNDGSRATNGHAFGREDAPPAHAHSPAPEERPPAHANAPHAAEPEPAPDGEAGTDGAAGTDDGAGTDDADGTELDTDVVSEDAVRPDPDRSQSSAGSPILVAPPPPDVVLAAPPLGTSPGSPFADPAVPAPGGDGEGADAAAGDGSEAGGHLAAPDPHRVPDVFLAPELTRRVAVPIGLLIAGLLYLLAQGRIDRGGRLLLAPDVDGTEGDDEVYEL